MNFFASRASEMKPSAVREILKVTERPDVISFAGGLPAPELFPVAEIAGAAQAVLAREGAAALQYGVTEGHGPLREWVAAQLRATAGITADPQRILITNGSQQGLDLVSKLLLDPGDIVLTEDPAYLGALQVFKSYQARVVGLEADEHGLRPEALRTFLETASTRATGSTGTNNATIANAPAAAPKFLYLIPNFQNPTGVTLAAGRREEIARIASEAGLPVIEDDPYGRLRFEGAHVPALSATKAARDGNLRYVYLGTASKILAPGLRVAWLTTPDAEFFAKLVTAKQAVDLHTSSFTQRLVWEYASKPGRLDAHVQRLRATYAARRDAMLAALARHLPDGCRWTRPEGGMFLWVTLPPAVDTVELLREAGREGIAFVPGAPFAVREGGARNTMRLNFSNAGEARIETGIARLGRVVRAIK